MLPSWLLERILGEHSGRLSILGDLNFHVQVDDPRNSHVTQFKGILEAFNLKQLVKGATHVFNGHTLDLLITTDDLLVKCVVVRGPALSERCAVVVNFRKLRSINMDSLREDIRSSSLIQSKLLIWIPWQVSMMMYRALYWTIMLL